MQDPPNSTPRLHRFFIGRQILTCINILSTSVDSHFRSQVDLYCKEPNYSTRQSRLLTLAHFVIALENMNMNMKVYTEYMYGLIKTQSPYTASTLSRSRQSVLSTLMITLSLLVLAPCVHAEFFNNSSAKAKWYKWVDEKGQTHYSETPPPTSTNASTVELIKAGGSKPSQQAEAIEKLEKRRKTLLENASQRTESKNDASADLAKSKQQEARQKNCETAKNNLAQFQSGGQIKMKNSDGEYEYLDQDAIEKQQAKNQAYLKDNCGS